jgi:hypothetical protein
MYSMVKKVFPNACNQFEGRNFYRSDIFREYDLYSIKLSRSEILAISTRKDIDTKNVTKKGEFKQKLQRLGLENMMGNSD